MSEPAAPDPAAILVVDADGDGVPLADDCDDNDAAVHPDRDEECSGWVDDDCDGLVDCEDADCQERCVEDCTGDLDEDQDGLVDCADDDCAFEAVCLRQSATAQVTGGTRVLHRRRYFQKESDGLWDEGDIGRNEFWWESTDRRGHVVYSAEGSLHLPGVGVDCAWGVDHAAWYSSYINGSSDYRGSWGRYDSAIDFARSGFWISSACPVQSSDFLMSWRPLGWYAGRMTSSTAASFWRTSWRETRTGVRTSLGATYAWSAWSGERTSYLHTIHRYSALSGSVRSAD